MAALGWDKWNKYKVMRASEALAAHLPETRWMSETSLWNMLGKYNKVIVKPSAKSGGVGVIQISAEANNKYEVHAGTKRKTLYGKSQTYNHVKKLISRSYIVQRCIPLARINGRPFDLRVMVQRKRDIPWTITGKLVKVAGKGHIVTNIARSRGTVLPLETAVARSNLKNKAMSRIHSKINHVVLASVKKLQRSYPSIRIVGLDIGLDANGKVWIIEANYAPSKSLFLKLQDKSMYRKIVAFR